MSEKSFMVENHHLRSVLDRTSGAVAPNGALPVLLCFYFEVSPSGILVATSNLENTVVTRFSNVEAESSFKFIVPAAKLQAIVRQADSGLMSLIVNNNLLKIVAGSTSWDVKLPIGEFPKLPDLTEPKVHCEIPHFREALKAVRKSVATDAMRPSLRMVDVSKGKMTGCDGVRLSQAVIQGDFPTDFSMAIPLSTMDIVWDLLRSETIGLSNLEQHYLFVVEDTYVVANKPTSRFPNVEQLMLRPALENKLPLLVDRAELLRAIDRVRINADPDTDAIGLSLSAKSITVTTRDKNGNGSAETLPSNWSGKDRMLVVNHKYLTQLVRSSDNDTCFFALGEDTKSRKSVILLKDENKGVLGVIPQFSGNLRVF